MYTLKLSVHIERLKSIVEVAFCQVLGTAPTAVLISYNTGIVTYFQQRV